MRYSVRKSIPKRKNEDVLFRNKRRARRKKMNDDENLKKTKKAVDMLMLQQKARDYQDKLSKSMNKEYQGRYQGISMKMKGDFTLLDVKIDQSFYETASKSQIEQGIMALFRNLHNAISSDQEALKEELQMDISAIQKDQTL